MLINTKQRIKCLTSLGRSSLCAWCDDWEETGWADGACFLARSSRFLAKADEGSGLKIKSQREQQLRSPLSSTLINLSTIIRLMHGCVINVSSLLFLKTAAIFANLSLLPILIKFYWDLFKVSFCYFSWCTSCYQNTKARDAEHVSSSRAPTL